MPTNDATQNAAGVVRDPDHSDADREAAAKGATNAGATLSDVRAEVDRQDRAGQ